MFRFMYFRLPLFFPLSAIALEVDQSHCVQEITLKIRYFDTELSKSLKKVDSIFLLNPVPFNGQSYHKQKGPGTKDH